MTPIPDSLPPPDLDQPSETAPIPGFSPLPPSPLDRSDPLPPDSTITDSPPEPPPPAPPSPPKPPTTGGSRWESSPEGLRVIGEGIELAFTLLAGVILRVRTRGKPPKELMPSVKERKAVS